MRAFPILLLGVVTLALDQDYAVGADQSAARARNRWYRTAQVAVPVPVAVPTPGFPVPGFYGYPSFSSTPMEGAGRGFAEILRAQGEAARARSEAALNWEEARSRYIDNARKWTEVYQERRRLGEAQRAAEYAQQREVRDRYLAQKESGAPERLAAHELDQTTGEIRWPLALLGDEFAAERLQAERLFQLRSQTRVSAQLADRVADTADVMLARLNANIRDMAPNDYIAARRFLESLAYEARFPA